MSELEKDPADPKGLIREAYRIEGITGPECRTIFMDWALTGTGALAQKEALSSLLSRHGAHAPEHPMTEVLNAALAPAAPARRRGGWRARRDA